MSTFYRNFHASGTRVFRSRGKRGNTVARWVVTIVIAVVTFEVLRAIAHHAFAVVAR